MIESRHSRKRRAAAGLREVAVAVSTKKALWTAIPYAIMIRALGNRLAVGRQTLDL